MGKYIMVVTNEQIERSKARKKPLKHWSITQCATTVRVLKSPAKGQQIKYIADASIKRLTNRSHLYMHRLRNK